MRSGIILLCVGVALGAGAVFSAFQFTGDSHSTSTTLYACSFYTYWANTEPIAIETARAGVTDQYGPTRARALNAILQAQLDIANSVFTIKEKACG